MDELEKAREALQRDRPGAALGNAWDAAARAIRNRDEAALLAVQNLAGEIEERATGRDRTDAHRLVAYCEACIEDVRSGVHRDTALWRLFNKP